MKKHLRVAWRGMVRTGLYWTMYNVLSNLVSMARGRGPIDWTLTALSIPVVMALYGLGSLLAGVILLGVRRHAGPPTNGVRVMAGMAAGAVIGALVGILFLLAGEDAGTVPLTLLAGMAYGGISADRENQRRAAPPPSPT